MTIDLAALGMHDVISAPAGGNMQEVGNKWLAGRHTAVLSVPSVLAPCGRNYLINPLHLLVAGAILIEIEDFKFDERLWNIF